MNNPMSLDGASDRRPTLNILSTNQLLFFLEYCISKFRHVYKSYVHKKKHKAKKISHSIHEERKKYALSTVTPFFFRFMYSDDNANTVCKL